MSYHLALSSFLDLERITLEAQQGKRPSHVMWDVCQKLNATVHMPVAQNVRLSDRLGAKLIGLPEHWALARQLTRQLSKNDVIFCSAEDIGLPLATLFRGNPDRPKIICFFHTANRPRVRLMLKLFQLREVIDVFVSNTQSQLGQLQRTLKEVDASRLFYLSEQVDDQFFHPGPRSNNKPRPIIASAGLEKRDYRLLAQATADLDLDVKITGFSGDVRALAKSFPKTLPANMSRRYYDWTELLQLYRDADIVVVSLFESVDSAGITTLLEAMACGCPVIATQTTGLADYINNSPMVISIKPGDLEGLRAAIAYLLNQPDAAETLGKQAYEQVCSHYNSQKYVDTLTGLMRSVHDRVADFRKVN